jgi:predicted TIM-barrel fold metal-dependent hydrolase
MTHLASFITEGVFDRYPGLRVFAVGCGGAWVPGYLWRLDYWWKTSKLEAPWMQKAPSEYFVENVRLCTYGLEWPDDPERMITALSAVPGIEDLLLYGSGYPNYDFEEPDEISARLPENWREKVMVRNAEALFRWPDDGRRRAGAAASEAAGQS